MSLWRVLSEDLFIYLGWQEDHAPCRPTASLEQHPRCETSRTRTRAKKLNQPTGNVTVTSRDSSEEDCSPSMSRSDAQKLFMRKIRRSQQSNFDCLFADKLKSLSYCSEIIFTSKEDSGLVLADTSKNAKLTATEMVKTAQLSTTTNSTSSFMTWR